MECFDNKAFRHQIYNNLTINLYIKVKYFLGKNFFFDEINQNRVAVK